MGIKNKNQKKIMGEPKMQIPKTHKDYKRIGMDDEGGVILVFDDCHTYIPPKETKAIAYWIINELGIKISKEEDISYKEE